MKRKIAWLALPLVLGILMFAAKWRAEHPTPTKEDLEIRAMMMKLPVIRFSHFYTTFPPQTKDYNSQLSQSEMKPFMDSFYLSPHQNQTPQPLPISKGITSIRFYATEPAKMSTSVAVELYERSGQLTISRSYKKSAYNIHPVTVKRWMELLLANPRIGPELHARMNQ